MRMILVSGFERERVAGFEGSLIPFGHFSIIARGIPVESASKRIHVEPFIDRTSVDPH